MAKRARLVAQGPATSGPLHVGLAPELPGRLDGELFRQKDRRRPKACVTLAALDGFLSAQEK